MYAILGLLIGFCILIFDKNATFHFGDKELHGVLAGLIAVPVMPLLMAIVGFFHAIFIWFPIVYIYRKLTNKS
jgi:hypothetical protein